jgi:hypothetical protein
MRIDSRCSQNVAIVRGKGRLAADIDLAAINNSRRGPVYQTVDERRVGILKNLLNPAAELVRWLGPIVVFHGDNENRFDFFAIFRARDQVTNGEQQGKYAQHAETSDVRH